METYEIPHSEISENTQLTFRLINDSQKFIIKVNSTVTFESICPVLCMVTNKNFFCTKFIFKWEDQILSPKRPIYLINDDLNIKLDKIIIDVMLTSCGA